MADPEGVQQARAPLNFDRLCVFFIQFCIRNLQNKGSMREHLNLTIKLPGHLNRPLDPGRKGPLRPGSTRPV